VQAFRLGAEPFFFSHARARNARQTYASIMDYFVILLVIAMVGLSVNVEILKYFIKAEDVLEQANYWSGLRIVPVLLFGYVLLGIYTNLSIWYKLSDQTRFAWYISGLGALVTIVLSLWLIPRYSYVGATWVTVCAYAVMVLLSYAWGQKHYPIPYKTAKSLAYLMSGAGICWLAYEVFDRDLLWGNVLLIGFVLVTLLIERKGLKAHFGRAED
jgi:O-antigen/teichoic acid export membrane protein